MILENIEKRKRKDTLSSTRMQASLHLSYTRLRAIVVAHKSNSIHSLWCQASMILSLLYMMEMAFWTVLLESSSTYTQMLQKSQWSWASRAVILIRVKNDSSHDVWLCNNNQIINFDNNSLINYAKKARFHRYPKHETSLYFYFSLPTEKFMRGQGEKNTPAEKGNYKSILGEMGVS